MVDSRVFRNASRRIVLELVFVAVVTAGSQLPGARSYSDGWEYVVTDPFLLLHVIGGALALLESVVLAVRCLRARKAGWSILSTMGTLSVLVAFAYGDRFIAHADQALAAMTVGWVAATAVYAVGWYVGRRQSRTVAQASL